MELIWLIGFIGLIGLIVGSFLNVLIYRLNTPKVPKFWEGRSFCPKCRHELKWYDNIPVVSFLVLGRRCRYCHTPISWQYPIVELVTGIVSVAVFLLNPNASMVELLNYWVIGCVFIVIFFSDLIYGLIPDEMIYLGVLTWIIYGLLVPSAYPLAPSLLVGIFARFFFLGIVWLTKYRGMGLGDIKLGFLMGLLLGWPNILIAIWAGFILGGLVSVVLLALKHVKFSATIPLGPFLVLGTIIAALWSNNILTLLGF